MNFPSHLNCDGKIVSEMGPSLWYLMPLHCVSIVGKVQNVFSLMPELTCFEKFSNSMPDSAWEIKYIWYMKRRLMCLILPPRHLLQLSYVATPSRSAIFIYIYIYNEKVTRLETNSNSYALDTESAISIEYPWFNYICFDMSMFINNMGHRIWKPFHLWYRI